MSPSETAASNRPKNIAAEGVKVALVQLRAAARTKAREADEAFLTYPDPRVIQSGAICETAQQWRALAAALSQAILFAEEIEE